MFLKKTVTFEKQKVIILFTANVQYFVYRYLSSPYSKKMSWGQKLSFITVAKIYLFSQRKCAKKKSSNRYS